jgi:hypothetical protein
MTLKAKIDNDTLNFFIRLQTGTERDSYNLPKYLLNPQLIPDQDAYNSVDKAKQLKLLAQAKIEISLIEGYPTFLRRKNQETFANIKTKRTVNSPNTKSIYDQSSHIRLISQEMVSQPSLSFDLVSQGKDTEDTEDTEDTKDTKDTKYVDNTIMQKGTPVPIWSRLPHEPEDYHKLFEGFLRTSRETMLVDGAFSQLHTLANVNAEYGHILSINEIYIYYYWEERAKAYDIYKPMVAARLRDHRVLIAEDTHYRVTANIISGLQDELAQRMLENEGRAFRGMKTSEILAATSSMIQMNRVSVGLPSHGPRIGRDATPIIPHSSPNKALRDMQIAYDGQTNIGLSKADALQADISRVIANDPEGAERLQEVAINIFMQTRQKAEKDKKAAQQAEQAKHHGPPKD